MSEEAARGDGAEERSRRVMEEREVDGEVRDKW